MGSFAGCSFKERGQNAQTFPLWTKTELLVQHDLPAGNVPIVVSLGLDVERLDLVVRCTAAELVDLYDQVLESGELTYSWETCDALLEAIDGVTEVSAEKDTYFATLKLIRL